MIARRDALARSLSLVVGATLALTGQPALADQATATSNSNQAVSARGNLDFVVNIGQFVFLRVGTGAYPNPSATVDTVGFALAPTIPAGAVVPTNGSNKSVAWNGLVPTSVAPATTTLPVEVRSNAGQISLTATATSSLSNGSSSIPLSQILISSDQSTLPAPIVPDTGTGSAVSVTGTTFSNLVTQRAANWTFSYANTFTPAPGAYAGTITFTATSP